MSEKNKKPNVFPKKAEKLTPEEFERAKLKVTEAIFDESSSANDDNKDAIEQMRERTAKQMKEREENGFVRDTSKSMVGKHITTIKKEPQVTTTQSQISQRDEQLRKNKEQILKFQKDTKLAEERHLLEKEQKERDFYNSISEVEEEEVEEYVESDDYEEEEEDVVVSDKYIDELSQPNFNSPFDVIPLPSMGKNYRNRKPNIRLAYMTTADENILTSPNLLNSGQFLEILFNRKMLDTSLRYNDLLPGDRNAIMIWLRATAYGEMYPVTLFDEFDEPFDTMIDLNQLQTITSSVEPDEKGLYEYILPLMGTTLKLRMLTCGDIDEITERSEKDVKKGNPVNNLTLYRLEKMIVEVDGNKNKKVISDFVNTIRIADAKSLNEYIKTLESDIDLNIVVETPGGGSVATFLPLNINFFWPNIGV